MKYSTHERRSGYPNTTIITPARHRILSLALALCLVLGMTLYLPGPVAVRAAETVIQVNTLTADTSETGWNYNHSNKVLFLTGPGPFILTGTNADFAVVVDAPAVEITLRNVSITSNSGIYAYASALRCENNTVILTLEGSNFLQGSNNPAGCGIRTNSTSLTITGSGSLEARAGGGILFPCSGIGTMGNTSHTVGEITITGNAQVTAIGRNGAAGIGGGGDSIGGGTVAITGNARVTATGGGASGGYDIGGRANDAGSLYVGDGAYLELTSCGTNVSRTDGSLEIGECIIVDYDSENHGALTGTYHWLLVDDGAIDTVATTVEPFWLTDGARQIIRAGDTVQVDAAPGFARWYTSGNITLANPAFDPTRNPAVFNMPEGNAWIAYTNLSGPLSVSPDTLSLDLDNNRTGTVTVDMGVDDSDGLTPLATQVTAVSDDPAVAEVAYGPHTGDVTITAKGPGEATVTFTFNDSAATALPVTINVAGSTTPGPSVSTTYLELETGESDTFFVSLGEGYNGAESATITSNNTAVATVSPPPLGQSGDVTVTGVAKGEALITIGYSGGSRHDDSDTVRVTVTEKDGGGDNGNGDGNEDNGNGNGNGDNGNGDGNGDNGNGDGDGNGGNTGGSSGTRSGSFSSGGTSTPDGSGPKTQLPATAFSWDGRTLTIDHERITPLGLLTVQWDGKALERGTDYAVYQGSVIVRFAEEFTNAQSPGEHTIRVEFLNHTGETTVTVGETGALDDLFDNDTHNPNTGGYPDGSYPGATDNPNTGDGGIWPALLLGSMSGLALVKLRPVLRQKKESGR